MSYIGHRLYFCTFNGCLYT